MQEDLINAITGIFPSNYNKIDPLVKSGHYDDKPFVYGILANIAVNASRNDKSATKQYMDIYKLAIKLDKAQTSDEKDKITDELFEKVFK